MTDAKKKKKPAKVPASGARSERSERRAAGGLVPPLTAKVRVVSHDREISAEPELLTPEEEAFNRFLEESEEESEPLADSGSDRV